MSRYSNYGDTRGENIFYDYCAGSNADIIRDADAPDNLGVLADVDVVADDGGVVRIAAVASDTAVAMDDAALSNPGLGIHDDGTEVLQMQVFAEAAGADDEAEAGAETVLATPVPKTE